MLSSTRATRYPLVHSNGELNILGQLNRRSLFFPDSAPALNEHQVLQLWLKKATGDTVNIRFIVHV